MSIFKPARPETLSALKEMLEELIATAGEALERKELIRLSSLASLLHSQTTCIYSLVNSVILNDYVRAADFPRVERVNLGVKL